MRKEILFAIIAGVLFGAVLAFGIWRANSALKEPEVSTAAISPTPSDEVENVTDIRLTLATPSDLDVITETPTGLSGVTSPEAWVVVSAEDDDYIMRSDTDGNISVDIDLVGGVNQILVVSFDNNGKSAEENLSVVFSTEFDKGFPEITEEVSEEEDEDTDAVREKVQEKLEEARNNPKAYLGTITDILEDTIQIKSDLGEIQQMSIGDETEFVKIGDSSQEIDFDDVAIGDYTVSMGYISDNELLDARRILITSATEELKRQVVFGNVLSTGSGEFTLETSSSELTLEAATNADTTIDVDGERENIRFSEISEGDVLIAVGSIEDGVFEARTIHVVSSSEPNETEE